MAHGPSAGQAGRLQPPAKAGRGKWRARDRLLHQDHDETRHSKNHGRGTPRDTRRRSWKDSRIQKRRKKSAAGRHYSRKEGLRRPDGARGQLRKFPGPQTGDPLQPCNTGLPAHHEKNQLGAEEKRRPGGGGYLHVGPLTLHPAGQHPAGTRGKAPAHREPAGAGPRQQPGAPGVDQRRGAIGQEQHALSRDGDRALEQGKNRGDRLQLTTGDLFL